MGDKYIDIILTELHKCKIEGDMKILVLGNTEKKLEVIVPLIDLLFKKYRKSYTLITRDPEFQNALYKLKRTDDFINIYAQFSKILINMCFNNNWFLYIDSQDYSRFDIDLIKNHINFRNQLGIFFETNQNINSYIDSQIKFDYIFLFDNEKFKDLDYKKSKYRDIIYHLTGEETLKQLNKDNTITEIYSKDIVELIETIDKSNEINEKIYLVLNVKEKKLMYLQM